MKDKIIKKVDEAIELLETIRIDINLKSEREGIDEQASDLNLLLYKIRKDIASLYSGGKSDDKMKCNTCGESFNPANLSEVFLHEHNDEINPSKVIGIKGKKIQQSHPTPEIKEEGINDVWDYYHALAKINDDSFKSPIMLRDSFKQAILQLLKDK